MRELCASPKDPVKLAALVRTSLNKPFSPFHKDMGRAMGKHRAQEDFPHLEAFGVN